jgi:hypothetical protein
VSERKIHYAGGIRARTGGGFKVILRGWPVCGAGISADRQSVNPGTAMDANPDGVTCAKCRKLIEAQNRYLAELLGRATALCVRDEYRVKYAISRGDIEAAETLIRLSEIIMRN